MFNKKFSLSPEKFTHSCYVRLSLDSLRFSSCNLVYPEIRLSLEGFQAGLTILKTKRQFSSLSTKTLVPLLMVFHLILLTRE